MGELLSPREPIELVGGDGDAVLKGEAKAIGKITSLDYTYNFLKGSKEVLKLIKSRNPSVPAAAAEAEAACKKRLRVKPVRFRPTSSCNVLCIVLIPFRF